MEKAKGKGLSAWRTQWTNNINQWVLDDATTFAFQEESLQDEQMKAQTASTRAGTRKSMVEAGEISPEESRNLAVDQGDLPEEFEVDLVEIDDPITPYVGKSISEVACNGASACIGLAINQATGIWLREWPFRPEKVLAALERL